MSRRAWHFVGPTLRDGRPVPADGEWLEHAGSLKLCASGLHSGPTPWNALLYAPGLTLCDVLIDGQTIFERDKSVSQRRCIVRRANVAPWVLFYARMAVLHATHEWDAPDAVLDFLMSGDARRARAARVAAENAARSASEVARLAEVARIALTAAKIAQLVEVARIALTAAKIARLVEAQAELETREADTIMREIVGEWAANKRAAQLKIMICDLNVLLEEAFS